MSVSSQFIMPHYKTQLKCCVWQWLENYTLTSVQYAISPWRSKTAQSLSNWSQCYWDIVNNHSFQSHHHFTLKYSFWETRNSTVTLYIFLFSCLNVKHTRVRRNLWTNDLRPVWKSDMLIGQLLAVNSVSTSLSLTFLTQAWRLVNNPLATTRWKAPKWLVSGCC